MGLEVVLELGCHCVFWLQMPRTSQGAQKIMKATSELQGGVCTCQQANPNSSGDAGFLRDICQVL